MVFCTLTIVVDVESTELELDSLQRLAEGLVVMRNAALGAGAERQRKVAVGFLAVVVRADRVDPQHHLAVLVVLRTKGEVSGVIGSRG